MIRKLKNNFKNYFLGNKVFFKGVSFYTFGTLASQLLTFIFSPLIARIYNPENFGDLSLFLSIVTLVTSISTGLYEQGIGLPKKSRTANAIAIIAGVISIMYSILLFVLLILFFPIIKFEYFDKNWLFYVPLIVLISSLGTVFQYLLLRDLNYKEITIGTISLTLGNLIGAIVLNFLGFKSFGLIGGYILSNIFYFIILYFYISKNETFRIKENLKLPYLKKIALRYINFPKYQMPSNLFSIASNQIISILLVSLFSNIILGYFSMAVRLIKTPILLISSSIANVFRNDAIKEFNITGSCQKVYIKIFKLLFFLGLMPFIVLYLFIPKLIIIFFGANWEGAIIYAQIMCVPLFFEFIETPLRSIMVITENQKTHATIQLLSTILSTISIIGGNYYFNSPIKSIFCYAIACTLISIISIFLTYKYSLDKNYLKSII